MVAVCLLGFLLPCLFSNNDLRLMKQNKDVNGCNFIRYTCVTCVLHYCMPLFFYHVGSENNAFYSALLLSITRNEYEELL
uniref:Uncharacterized protein n=1 Tax=Aegilops tauschii subsp. strangulata TaxID=200361 RepID=A0A453RP34_AEGTS